METVEKRMGRLQHTKKTFGKPMEKNLLFQRLSTVPFPFAVMEQRMKIPFRACSPRFLPQKGKTFRQKALEKSVFHAFHRVWKTRRGKEK